VVEGTTIESAVHNGTVSDIETDLNAARPIIAGGTGATNAADAATNLGVVTGKTAIVYTDAEKTQARANIYAAPFNALAYNGMQVNGSMEVSQERGATALVMTSGSAHYAIDGWLAQYQATGPVFQVQQIYPSTPSGNQILTHLELKATTGGTVGTAASDIVRIFQHIEGYRLRCLGFGTLPNSSMTIAFWVLATVSGTMCLAINNGGQNRSYLKEIIISAANTWEYKTVTIALDTTGSWVMDNTKGMTLSFSSLNGSTFRGTADTWQNGFFFSTAATTNFFASSNNRLCITGVTILPGTQAPTAAQSPLIMRPYDQELVTCQRYLELCTGVSILGYMPNVGSNLSTDYGFKVSKRAAPTISPMGWGAQSGAGTPTTSYITIDGLSIFAPCTVAGVMYVQDIRFFADARL